MGIIEFMIRAMYLPICLGEAFYMNIYPFISISQDCGGISEERGEAAGRICTVGRGHIVGEAECMTREEVREAAL